ncbi:hypothetical protein ABZW30_44260 [Kitasatospora sp. NPDC004669]|uniref:hypothetical protein n=1 Tax=Kitasatospora sp. NPDC004669 TaxID=3154555 RepID=UPI0033ABF531
MAIFEGFRDCHHPGLRSHRYPGLPGHERAAAWTSCVDQGAGAWRLHWTWGSADGAAGHGRGEPDGAVVTVRRVGPHLWTVCGHGPPVCRRPRRSGSPIPGRA